MLINEALSHSTRDKRWELWLSEMIARSLRDCRIFVTAAMTWISSRSSATRRPLRRWAGGACRRWSRWTWVRMQPGASLFYEFMFTLSNGQQAVSGSRYRRVIQATIQGRPIQHPVLIQGVRYLQYARVAVSEDTPRLKWRGTQPI